MASLCTLASSSAGNSTYIACSTGMILIDAGVSCRKITLALETLGAQASDLCAVLLTHDHIDHIRGLRVLLKKTQAVLYAPSEVLDSVMRQGMLPEDTVSETVGDKSFLAGGMQILAFPTPHDSAGSVGYRVETADGHRLAVATDLGCVTDAVERGVAGCEAVVLESNYDPTLLRMGSYPYFLKQRIASDQGHLANEHSADFARRLVEGGTTRLVLGHLSRENNNPALARQASACALQAAGAVEGLDYELMVAPYDGPGRLIRI
ncbi:MAG: MBL fold metallo-hydrolase [Oscillospiraceae bacterium]